MYNAVANQLQKMNPDIVYSKPSRKPSSEKKARSSQNAAASTKKQDKTKGSKLVPQPAVPKGFKLGPQAVRPPQPVPAIDDRLPINSPMYTVGVAVEALRRDLEQEKERAKNGGGQIAGGSGGAEGEGKESKPKAPKMKRMVVRKRG